MKLTHDTCCLTPLLTLLLMVASAPALSSPGPASASAGVVEGTPSHAIRISGAVATERELDVAALKALTVNDSGPVEVVCASGATVGKVDNFRGVRLTDVINSVGIALEGHRDARRMVVIARATDGYVVTFSWNELFNTAIGKSVLVAWEKDGAPLDAGEGQLLLISGKDIQTGPRHVRWLSGIEILRMD